jgi:D-aminopeptidase
VGALTLANFGAARDLTIAGAPVGAHLTPPTARHSPPPPRGSCIVVLATDAPANSRQLGRIARRAQNGLARTGTITGHGSGDYAIAFSTARTVSHWPSDLVLPARELAEDGPLLDGLFQATTEATEEAVVNALFTADTTDGVDGHVCFGLPIDDVLQMLRQ